MATLYREIREIARIFGVASRAEALDPEKFDARGPARAMVPEIRQAGEP